MHENNRSRTEFECALDDLPNVYSSLVDRPFGYEFVADEHVLAVEMENSHAFHRAVRHIGVEIIRERLPVRQHRAFRDLGSQ